MPFRGPGFRIASDCTTAAAPCAGSSTPRPPISSSRSTRNRWICSQRALRFRHLFREGTSLRAWVVTIMRHRLLDIAKRTRDAMESAKCVPPEELSEWAYSDARAEQICFAKEALALAGAGLSEEQASVFWPILAGAT